MNENELVSKKHVFRHKRIANSILNTPVLEDYELTQNIDDHIKKYFGRVDSIMKEEISYGVHVNIHLVYPSDKHKHYTLITSGMSQKPMRYPYFNLDVYSELMICLPDTWKIEPEYWSDENWYWPIRWLFILASFPHLNTTYFVEGSSFSNDPITQFAPNTRFSGFVFEDPCFVPNDFSIMHIGPKEINILAVYPVYTSEMDYIIKNGSDLFFELAQKNQLTELVDIYRKPIIKSPNFFKKVLGFLRT